jgi:adenylosuccinate synthase
MDSFFQPGRVGVMFGGQFGSEGKGLLAGYLAEHYTERIDVCTTNASANAGHWMKYPDGLNDFVCFHLPTVGVIHKEARIYLNGGSIIDPELLNNEINTIDPTCRGRITIHPKAAVITQADKDAEGAADSSVTKIASTRKGVGFALARKIRREGNTADRSAAIAALGIKVGTIDLARELLERRTVSMEVPQGYSLGINSRFHPHCTSRNCSVAQGLADAGIPARLLGNVAAAVRTFPIRVGNIVEDAQQLGQSGGHYDDQRETSWEELGVKAELTTVTKRVRRVFTFSQAQLLEMLVANMPTHLFVNFMNYLAPGTEKDFKARLSATLSEYEVASGQTVQTIWGYGPTIADVRAPELVGR